MATVMGAQAVADAVRAVAPFISESGRSSRRNPFSGRDTMRRIELGGRMVARRVKGLDYGRFKRNSTVVASVEGGNNFTMVRSAPGDEFDKVSFDFSFILM